MASQHELDYDLAVLQYLGGCRVNHHTWGYGGDTGCQECAGAFVFHQADATGTNWGQMRVMAQCRDIYA